MAAIYHWGPNHSPHVVFPRLRIFGGKNYHLSLINPSLVKNTSKKRATSDVDQLHKEAIFHIESSHELAGFDDFRL
jgi:hypothetical protein